MWRAEGGMFDGCELDFDIADGGRGLRWSLSVRVPADDSPVVTLPPAVDETGDLTGVWIGTMDSPIGPVPIGSRSVRVSSRADLMDMADTDSRARPPVGWVRAQFTFEIAGFGIIEMIMRLGLTSAGLEGWSTRGIPPASWRCPPSSARGRARAPPGRGRTRGPPSLRELYITRIIGG